MNIEDGVILERIERLAFQAGLAGRGSEIEVPKPEAIKPEIEVLFRQLKKVIESHSVDIGAALYGSAIENNLTWEEIRAAIKVM